MRAQARFKVAEVQCRWTLAEGLEPFTLLPGQAVDLTLYWGWADEPYAMLRFGVYRYALQFA